MRRAADAGTPAGDRDGVVVAWRPTSDVAAHRGARGSVPAHRFRSSSGLSRAHIRLPRHPRWQRHQRPPTVLRVPGRGDSHSAEIGETPCTLCIASASGTCRIRSGRGRQPRAEPGRRCVPRVISRATSRCSRTAQADRHDDGIVHCPIAVVLAASQRDRRAALCVNPPPPQVERRGARSLEL